MVEPTLNLAHRGPPSQSRTHGWVVPSRMAALPPVALRSPKPNVMGVILLRAMEMPLVEVFTWTSPSVVMTVILSGL